MKKKNYVFTQFKFVSRQSDRLFPRFVANILWFSNKRLSSNNKQMNKMNAAKKQKKNKRNTSKAQQINLRQIIRDIEQR